GVAGRRGALRADRRHAAADRAELDARDRERVLPERPLARRGVHPRAVHAPDPGGLEGRWPGARARRQRHRRGEGQGDRGSAGERPGDDRARRAAVSRKLRAARAVVIFEAMALYDLASVFADQLRTAESEAGRIYEAVIGIVTDNKDPSKLGR